MLNNGTSSEVVKNNFINVQTSPTVGPQLMVQRVGNNAQITWKEPGCALESVQDLTESLWTPVSQTAVQNQDGSYTVRIPIETRRYFRLKRY